MEIREKNQDNQGVGKYKILSSNAGVGSLITTKSGYFVMPLSVSNWRFILDANIYVSTHLNFDEKTLINDLKVEKGVDIIDDRRFVAFLQSEEKIENLKFLISIPHLVLNDWNSPKVKDNPVNVRYNKLHKSGDKHIQFNSEYLSIPAIYFPKWFFSTKNSELHKIDHWRNEWRKKSYDLENFAPPRDANDIDSRHPYKKKDIKGQEIIWDRCSPLHQVPMVLICENGHISDIPWDKFFAAKLDGKNIDNIFSYQSNDCEKGGEHSLQWIENRNQSESWGVLKCKKCMKNVSLEGIMNITPYCCGERPWIENDKNERCQNTKKMRFALVTSNSVYYANTFSSLYIPQNILNNNPSVHIEQVISILEKIYKRRFALNPDLTKEVWINSIDVNDKLEDNGIIGLSPEDVAIVIDKFTKDGMFGINFDSYEEYRFQEYKVFHENIQSPEQEKDLIFEDIVLPNSLKNNFYKIQQVTTLAVSSTQLSFNRVKMAERIRDTNGNIVNTIGQNIFSSELNDVFVLPANQVYGEGIFFDLNSEKINDWCKDYNDEFASRYSKMNPNKVDVYSALTMRQKMQKYGYAKFYMLHSFSHLIMRELEFSCGYPTASLKERLYYSDKMCAVLIYTAEGSEGSMGGLVWQAQPELIKGLIINAMQRAEECSSDPLCWESDGQGLYDLNLAACFSCCLISETSCEERNLGLDRQVLINNDFGLFKNFINP